MVAKGILLLLFAFSLLVGTHYFFYRSTLFFLRIDGFKLKTILLLALGILCLSFPACMILGRLTDSPLIYIPYNAAAFWFGFAIHLVMALAVVWAVYGASRLLNRTVHMRTVFSLFVILTLGVTLAGTWIAKNPGVHRLEVKVADLPTNWEGRTLVHLSDLHLGSFHGAGFIEDVVEMVNALEPDVIAVTGDLFDGSCTDCKPFIGPLDSFRARHGVFFVTGNHEGYLGLDKPLAALSKTRIRVLNNECVDLQGLQILGMRFPEFQKEKSGEENPIPGMENYDRDKPVVLLYHTPTDVLAPHGGRSSQQVETYFSPDTDFRFARENGIDLQLSGHTHGGQIFPFNLLTGVLFSGYDSGVHTLGTFSIHTSCGTGTWGPPVCTAGRSEIVAITLRRRAG